MKTKRKQRKKVFVDTCVLVNLESFLRFLQNAEPGTFFCIPSKVVYELAAIIRNSRKTKDTRKSAFTALLLLCKLRNTGRLEFFGATDRIADAVFLDYAAQQIGQREDLCFLTSDLALSQDLRSFNRLESVRSAPIRTFSLAPDGRPVPCRSPGDPKNSFPKEPF